MTGEHERFSIDVHLGADDLAPALRADVRQGLTARPKELPPKWFYDKRGCELFDEITRLAQYYPTRREREILEREAPSIAQLCAAETLIELGSGTSEKTRLLLDALTGAGTLGAFVPFDVSEETLRTAGAAIARRYAGLRVHAVVGDFDHHLGRLPREGRRLIAFLGGTIGNFAPEKRSVFLRELAASLHTGDAFLLGVDLVKDPSRLVAAYNDDVGVTAEFNRNILHVLNRELMADFDVDSFAHVAVWDPENEWIEMRLRSSRAQLVTIPTIDLRVDFSEGEEMRTEISAKFRQSRIEHELSEAGLEPTHWWTDSGGDFALSLSVAR